MDGSFQDEGDCIGGGGIVRDNSELWVCETDCVEVLQALDDLDSIRFTPVLGEIRG